MPTYEYECQRCGYVFELFQNMSDPPRKRCPRCGGKVERRLGTGAGVIFRGSGFYATDYRSSEYRKAQRAESEKSSKESEAPKKDASPKDGGD
ncbi:MAG: zinc ribbon domain-containing protein [Verrucomicrobia bacterium]|nr:MAG: zinc ribbon domain-containing protein [Verrucomicrobiota bacterium]